MPAMALCTDVERAVVRQEEQDGGERPVSSPHRERCDRAADALGGRRGGDADEVVVGVVARRRVPARAGAAGSARDRGHAMRPSSPYISTEPGAPVRAEAVPVRSMPMPSPKNQTPSTHTKDRTSAGRTVRRKSRPNPMASWISAKNTFHTAMSGDTKLTRCVIRSPTTKGWPDALAWSWPTKPWPNMNGWNWRAASSSQKRPRTIWSTRWVRTTRGNRCAGSVSGPASASRSSPRFRCPRASPCQVIR